MVVEQRKAIFPHFAQCHFKVFSSISAEGSSLSCCCCSVPKVRKRGPPRDGSTARVDRSPRSAHDLCLSTVEDNEGWLGSGVGY